ncbi:16S rRNA pseudouridylate synthase A [Escherichia coli]|uniref:Dual-specificity RNA pseudouridine synthase RluF n=1 Tax=Escherichia coli TaxID=562 RepID=A0A376KQR6_ECOLX|nr:16S rRNA pseudouridylate synthase A [Escherichia coli]
MRLDKFIAQQLGVSRAIAGREIRGNRVTVDGEIVRNAAFKLLPEHDVAYDGNPLAQQHGPRYFMLNKPQGYVLLHGRPLITQRCSIFLMNR